MVQIVHRSILSKHETKCPKQGWQKTRKFEKARKSPGFFKKPGLYLGLFQMPGFFKNAMFEKKTGLLKLDVYCIMKYVLILQLEIDISLNGNSAILYNVLILYYMNNSEYVNS